MSEQRSDVKKDTDKQTDKIEQTPDSQPGNLILKLCIP